MAEEKATENLHVPQAKSAGGFSSQSVKSIMDAYRTQSKIQLYDDNSAQSHGAGNENIGVTGRDIPLAMLRPSANPVKETVDENGNRVFVGGDRNAIRKAMQESNAIADAYRKMKGLPETDYGEGENEEGDYVGGGFSGQRTAKDLSSVKRYQAEYMEDMPDTDEGLLEVLELAIRNARANAEMLESLYAALSPSMSNDRY